MLTTRPRATAGRPAPERSSGVYPWTASYSGDVNNAPAQLGCTPANDASAVGASVGSDASPGGGAQGQGARARVWGGFGSGPAGTRRLGFASTPMIDGVLLDDGKRAIGGAPVT